jgi:hypothetical protein
VLCSPVIRTFHVRTGCVVIKLVLRLGFSLDYEDIISFEERVSGVSVYQYNGGGVLMFGP